MIIFNKREVSSARRMISLSRLCRTCILLSLSLSYCIGLSDDPNDPCSTHALNAYRKCILDNPCKCRNCFSDPNDPGWVVEAPEPRSCYDISNIFCPMVRCCTPCESTNSFYHSCLAARIATLYLGGNNNCQFFICTQPPNDFLGNCTTTTTTASDSNPCQKEVSDYLTCAASANCSSCQTSGIAALQLPTNTQTCRDMNSNVFCPLQNCCPACSKKLEALGSCVKYNVGCSTTPCSPSNASSQVGAPSAATLLTSLETSKQSSSSTTTDATSAGERWGNWTGITRIALAFAGLLFILEF